MGRLAPKSGDECLSCADYWDNQNPPKPRQRLVLIGNTLNKKIQVPICPYCDGERAIDIAKAKPKK